MALTLGDNFSYGGSKPLDARLTYSTLADMKAVADATMYNGCLAYCVATDKTYQWKSTNTVDTDTGKWREFSTGSTIVIDDEIDDTSENPVQNAVIADALDGKQDKLTAGTNIAISNDNIISTTSTYTMRYSTQEQVVGTWIDLKPLYQKTIDFGALPNNSTKATAHNITNLKEIVDLRAIYKTTSGEYGILPMVNDTSLERQSILSLDSTNIYMRTLIDRSNLTAYITLQYTKTTDV